MKLALALASVLTIVASQIQASHVPAASYAVVRGDTVELGASGDGVTPDTPFVIGSLSKSFTAIAVLQLVDAGSVELDADVRTYLPSFRTAGGDTITVRQLLNQTSGLPTAAGLAFVDHPEQSLAERVDGIADVELVSAPGTEFHYCNLNYAVLGYLVEQASGQGFGEYLQEHVFEPLDMTGSSTDPTQAHAGSTVWFGFSRETPPGPVAGGAADGFLVSTARDMGNFLQFHLGDGTWRGEQVLSPTSMDRMHDAVVPTPVDTAARRTDAYAMGWAAGEIAGQELLAHDGDVIGYHASMGLLPDTDSGIVVLTGHNGLLHDVGAPFDAGLDELAGETPPEPDTSFVRTYAVVDATFLAVVAGLVLWVRRRPRRRWISFARNLSGAVAVYAGVFWGLGTLAVGRPLSLRFATGFVSPELTVLVLLVCAALVVRALRAIPRRGDTLSPNPASSTP